jgi:hypothetical protein
MSGSLQQVAELAWLGVRSAGFLAVVGLLASHCLGP